MKAARRARVDARVVGATERRVEPVPGFEGPFVDLDQLWAKVDELPETKEASSAGRVRRVRPAI